MRPGWPGRVWTGVGREIQSELARTRRFRAVQPVTTPFVREDVTVEFSRPYERVEVEADGPAPVQVELDLSQLPSIDDTLPFALEAPAHSEPYELLELGLVLPAVAQPLIVRRPVAAPSRLWTIVAVTSVLIAAFAIGALVVLVVA